jgi:hypothetical protein
VSLGLTPCYTILRVGLDVAAVGIQRRVELEELGDCDAVVVGELGTYVIVDCSWRLGCVSTDCVTDCGFGE